MNEKHYLRLRVKAVDSPYIDGITEEGDEIRGEIAGSAYLVDIEHLRKGDIVTLIETEEAESPPSQPPTIRAHRLIIEPDYLIDISSLTACFSESGPHPMRYILGMLAPKEVTRPILLGNTANQFLDDSVNDNPERPASYSSSIRKAFTSDALKFVVCPDINASFFQDTRTQYEYIRHSVEALHHAILQELAVAPCSNPPLSALHWVYKAASTTCKATYACL